MSWGSNELFELCYEKWIIFLLSWQRSINLYAAAAAAKSLQSCPTLCDPIDGRPSRCPIPGILQVTTLEWVTISFPNAWKWKVKVKSFSCVWLFVTPWTAAYQAPPSMGFSRQEYWSGLPLPSPIDLYDVHINSGFGEELFLHEFHYLCFLRLRNTDFQSKS